MEAEIAEMIEPWRILVAVGAVALLSLAVMGIYNRLMLLKNTYLNMFAQIDVQLKRRHDLIPNLVATAKGYLKHESKTLEAVTKARNTAVAEREKLAAEPANTQALMSLLGAEGVLNGALGQLNIVVEDYPDLKGDEVMHRLSEDLTSTENRIALARQLYNDEAMAFNQFRQRFPMILVARFIGFGKDAPLLEFADREQIIVPPKVSFDDV